MPYRLVRLIAPQKPVSFRAGFRLLNHSRNHAACPQASCVAGIRPVMRSRTKCRMLFASYSVLRNIMPKQSLAESRQVDMAQHLLHHILLPTPERLKHPSYLGFGTLT